MSKNITPLNNKGEPHGLWEWYYRIGELMCKRFYQNGKRVGYSELYDYHNGKLTEKKYYL